MFRNTWLSSSVPRESAVKSCSSISDDENPMLQSSPALLYQAQFFAQCLLLLPFPLVRVSEDHKTLPPSSYCSTDDEDNPQYLEDGISNCFSHSWQNWQYSCMYRRDCYCNHNPFGGALKLFILNSHLSPNLVALPFFTLTPFFSKRQHGFIRKSTGLGQGTSLHSSLRSVTCVNERAHISQPCWPLVSSSCKMEVLH